MVGARNIEGDQATTVANLDAQVAIDVPFAWKSGSSAPHPWATTTIMKKSDCDDGHAINGDGDGDLVDGDGDFVVDVGAVVGADAGVGVDAHACDGLVPALALAMALMLLLLLTRMLMVTTNI